MSMDRSAIEAIRESETIAMAAEALHTAAASIGACALPADYTLHDIEKLLPTRRRMRGTMDTQSLADFTRFVRAYAEAGAAVFIDQAKMQATAVLNLGTREDPGHADMRATLRAVPTAAYKALTAAIQAPMTQMGAAEFLEDWASNLQCIRDDGTTISTGQAVAAVRKLTIEAMRKVESEQQQLRTTTSTFEDVQAKSAEPLPHEIRFTCEPALFLAPRTFSLRLGIQTGGKEPTVLLRMIKAEQHQQEMAEEMQQLLVTALDVSDGTDYPVVTVGLGSYVAS